jgi:hypothetical protein
MGYNFLDHPPPVPRNIFRTREAQPVRGSKPTVTATEAPVTASKPNEPSDAEVTSVLFRTLKRFPEAYRAVVEAFRQLSPDFAPV